MNLLLQTALDYAVDAGWPVFPCRPHGKAPLGSLVHNGVKDATTDPARITEWWTKAPMANIAVACGAPGPDVLDVDNKKGRNGLELLDRVRRAGLTAGAGAIIRTPSGGLHVWFEGTDQRGGAVGNGKALELKAVGGYVLLPPSFVRDPAAGYEGTYELIESRDACGTVDFAAIRQVLEPATVRPVRPLIPGDESARTRRVNALIRKVAETGEGNRNAILFWAAKMATSYGVGQDVYDALVAAAVGQGLPERDALATVESGKRHGRNLVAA